MYTIEAKALTEALALCQSAIAMGSKSESQSVILQFGEGLQLIASNSVVTHRSDLPVTCAKRVDTTVTVLPDVLAAYAKGVKQLTLNPLESHLSVKGDKRVQADIYYVGATDLPEFPEVTADADLESIAGIASTMLSRAASIQNRIDKQELSIQLSWGDEIELIVGDSHHVAVITAPVQTQSPGSTAMTLPRLARILKVGKNFAASESGVVAWSETDYVSITNQVTAVRRADAAKEAIAAKATLVVEMATADFKGALGSILGAAEETANVALTFTPDRVTCAVETGSSRGRAVLRPKAMRGGERSFNVSANHLNDCLGTVDGDVVRLRLLANNIVSLESTDAAKIKTIAAMATRA